jgi:hypothetical protein
VEMDVVDLQDSFVTRVLYQLSGLRLSRVGVVSDRREVDLP